MEIRKIEGKTEKQADRLRVCAYARVSDTDEREIHSLKVQKEYCESIIKSHPGWAFAGLFYDEGVSGTKVSRPGLLALMEACETHRVDMILTKSISRFSRNTVELLAAIRRLKDLGIDLYFEKENIHTLSEDGELMVTVMTSFAQEESRSISENVKWGIRRNFLRGIGNQFILYGYRWDGERFRVVEEEAEIVRRIFRSYLDGIYAETMEKQFRLEGITGPRGGHFSTATIRRILANERYTGNRILQKEYIADHLSHRRKRNGGELPRYFVENANPAIIEQEVFDEVQRRMKLRSRAAKTGNGGRAASSGRGSAVESKSRERRCTEWRK